MRDNERKRRMETSNAFDVIEKDNFLFDRMVNRLLANDYVSEISLGLRLHGVLFSFRFVVVLLLFFRFVMA